MIPKRRVTVPSTRRVLTLIVIGCAGFAAVADAGEPPTRAATLLLSCPDARTLRSELARYADSTRANDPFGAGEARYDRGWSEQREGLADSAIADFERAVALRGQVDEQTGLADAWIARGTERDVAAAAALMESIAPASRAARGDAVFRARLGWAMVLAGRPDSALRVFRSLLPELDADPMWRERAGRAAAAAGDANFAIPRLMPFAVRSRARSKPTVDALRAAIARVNPQSAAQLDVLLRQKVAQLEGAERIAVESMGGHRLQFNASDGFPLGAAVFTGLDRQPAAVVLMSAADSLTGYDSLVVTLRRSGLAVVLVERRGHGASVGVGCVLPSDAYGREDALEARIARDAFDALREASHGVPIDTSRIVMTGVREAAATAVLAATLDRRARVLLLISPDPFPVDRGITCARCASIRRPVFIQMAPEDLDLFVISDAIYQSADRAASWVADNGHSRGSGAEQFREDPTIGPRFARWLVDALKVPPAAAPKHTHRKG